MNNKKTSILLIVAFIIIVSGLIGITALTVNNRTRSLKNSTYNRFVACTLSIPPATRTQILIDKCWIIAENDTGIQVNHFKNAQE